MLLALRRRVLGEPGVDPQKRQPATVAHADQTAAAAIARVHRHLPSDEAPDYVKRRFQIINLWRPIENPAWDHPLAMVDYRSVNPDKDLIQQSLIFPDREGEIYMIGENPAHKWQYVSGLRPDEYILLKWWVSSSLFLGEGLT
jgi:hypothetical protein